VHRSEVAVSTFNGRRPKVSRTAYESLRARAIARLRTDLRSP
jgi:hypothetical protein